MTGSSGAADSSGDAPPACPVPDPITTVDGLAHRGRAESDTFIEILDLEARDDLVYGCTATQGMMTWDVSDDLGALISGRVGPPEISHRQFPRCQHVALDADGRRAAITNRGDEIQPLPWLFVYDIEDREQPVALRGWTGEASIEGVVWDGDRIFAAAHTAGILVFEDTGGDSLEQVGSFADADSDAWLPILENGLLYVAEGATGLRVYDVSGDDPVLLSTLDLGGSSRDLALDGDTLYVAASSSVARVDVSDPSSPNITAQASAAGTSVAVALGSDGLVYSAEWDEVRAYDPSDLTRLCSEVVPTGDDFSRVLIRPGASSRSRTPRSPHTPSTSSWTAPAPSGTSGASSTSKRWTQPSNSCSTNERPTPALTQSSHRVHRAGGSRRCSTMSIGDSRRLPHVAGLLPRPDATAGSRQHQHVHRDHRHRWARRRGLCLHRRPRALDF